MIAAALFYPCAACKAKPGEPCRSVSSGTVWPGNKFHGSRADRLREALGTATHRVPPGFSARPPLLKRRGGANAD